MISLARSFQVEPKNISSILHTVFFLHNIYKSEFPVQNFSTDLDPSYLFPWIWDPDPGWKISKLSGSWINIPDHISESLVAIVWVKNT